MDFRKTRRITLGFIGASLLVLAIGRCSPLAPSVSKSTLRGGDPSGADGGSGRIQLPPFSPINHEAKLVDEGGLVDELEIAADAEETVIHLSDAQIEQFKQNKLIALNVASKNVHQTRGVFRTSLKADEINALDGSFQTQVENTAENTLALKVSDQVKDSVSQKILRNLISVHLILDSKSGKGDDLKLNASDR